jgi:hypothetical protein
MTCAKAGADATLISTEQHKMDVTFFAVIFFKISP